MNQNGKGSSRRGTSKEERKRFEDNYDEIFKKPKPPVREEKPDFVSLCLECDCDAEWVRCSQFAGNHPYCDFHAKQEKDFGDENDSTFWQTINDFLKRRK